MDPKKPAFAFVLLLLSSGALFAFDSSCIDGTSPIPSSGTCNGGNAAVPCGDVSAGCCSTPPTSSTCEIAGGNPPACAQKQNTVPLSLPCATFNDNEQACRKYAGQGCSWDASSGISGTNALGCKSYGETCSGNTCCGALVCTDFLGSTGLKCTQPPGVCTVLPEVASAIIPSMPAGGSPGGPLNVTNELISGQGVAGSQSGVYKTGWFSNWGAAGLIGVATAIIIIALAAMVGYGFNLPEVKAFVDTEFRQAIVSVLLIIGLLGCLLFFDVIARGVIYSASLPVSPGQNEPLYVSAAKSYLTSTIDMGNEYALDQLKESHKYQATASTGMQGQLNFWFLLFAGSNIRYNAGMSMKAERAGALFETTTKMIASLHAQRYFIDVVSFGIAPLFLLFGITLRTFFFTRKLGGLLLAMAVSLFFIYPLTYAFAWYTLNVTVYGDRAFSTPDPNCPSECTVRYPVAFFVNSTSGELLQFDSTQKLMLSGITTANWGTGDVNSDGVAEFPGLVACRDLSKAKLNVPFSCGGCPDYCRDVPYPSSMPGCNITACASDKCNPGCKIMRQRTDCNAVCSVDANCPLTCRTKVPTEDKCYFADEALGSSVVHPANFSTSCAGCDGCPSWCLFLQLNESTGAADYVYKDEPGCQSPACKLPKDGGTCKRDCFYYSEIGKAANCEAICAGCPVYCRVLNLSSSNPLISKYDTTGIIPGECEDSSVLSACKACKSMCKVGLPASPGSSSDCAPYPEKNFVFTNCTGCPEYCRFDSFSFINTSYSNTKMDGSIPSACSSDPVTGKPACSSSGSPAECSQACHAAGTPLLCREYSDAGGEPTAFCRQCPDVARVKLTHATASAGTETTAPALDASVRANCAAGNCGSDCKTAAAVPSQQTVGNTVKCKDFDSSSGDPHIIQLAARAKREKGTARLGAAEECSTCPISCRVFGAKNGVDITSLLDPSICSNAACGSCPNTCKADLSGVAPTKCVEYVGSGPAGQCSGTIACAQITNRDSCINELGCIWDSYYECDGPNICPFQQTEESCLASPSCSWVAKSDSSKCFGLQACRSHASKSACLDDPSEGCIWRVSNDPTIPLAFRDAAYQDATSCRQCPENCRIDGYTGDCGLEGVFGLPAADCSAIACPAACKVSAIPSPSSVPSAPQCKEYPAGKSCEGCPALCRRSEKDKPPSAYCLFAYSQVCGYDSLTGEGCSSDCRLLDAPSRMCEGCFDCPSDCTFYPAIRSDCSEVCTDEALAGPVSISPDDFVKKLPGAEGEVDVKNIGTLMLPALVMPLFCIVIVVAFIRVFSPILGGDIEIPGLSRII